MGIVEGGVSVGIGADWLGGRKEMKLFDADYVGFVCQEGGL